MRVADADGRDLPLGEIGEIVVKGDSVMAGYWAKPAPTCSHDWQKRARSNEELARADRTGARATLEQALSQYQYRGVMLGYAAT